MAFRDEEDNRTVADMVEFEVARRGLDRLVVDEDLPLVENLLRNAQAIDETLWLRWLTDGRGLIRLAKIVPDEQWIESLPFTRDQRTDLANICFLPFRECGGAWLVACLRNSKERNEAYAKKWGKPIINVAPTLTELLEIYKHYGRRSK